MISLNASKYRNEPNKVNGNYSSLGSPDTHYVDVSNKATFLNQESYKIGQKYRKEKEVLVNIVHSFTLNLQSLSQLICVVNIRVIWLCCCCCCCHCCAKF